MSFTDVLVAVALFIAIAAVFSIPVGLFNTKMFRGINGSKPGGGQVVRAYLPFVNIRYSRVLAYGSSTVFLVFLCVAAVMLLLRFVAVGLVIADIGFGAYLYMITPLCTLGALAIWYVLSVVNAVDFANMLGAGGITKVFCVLCSPIGYYMLSNAVLPYFKREETTVHGTFGAEN